ncbi:hypothetical protein HDU98_006135 [Podochytrium sp. JEL0797]|nr:hypothetical protein HDU98_006135 [Podochytrium sp. JEL0797]
MNDLEQDLWNLKLAILKESIDHDIQNSRNQGVGVATRSVSNPIVSSGGKNAVSGALDFSALESRMNTLLDHLESAASKVPASGGADGTHSHLNPSTADMIQSITLQNAQLHGLIMANMVASTKRHHTHGHDEEESGVPYPRSRYVEEGGSTASSAQYRRDYNDRKESMMRGAGPAELRRNAKSNMLKRPNKKFRRAAFLVLFLVRLIKEGAKFRESSKKVGRVIEEAETQLISVFKERKTFFKAIETVIGVTKEGTSLVYKETFANPKRRGVVLQEKVISIADLVVEAIEKISVDLLNERFGPGNACLRVFDYLISSNVQFPTNFIWAAESHDLLTSPTVRRTSTYKLSENTGRIHLLYFLAKTLLLKVLCHPVDQNIVNKHNPLLETNLVALARGNTLVEGDAEEFNSALPNGDFRSSWISPQLVAAIQGWAGRLRDWSVETYRDLEKGAN